MTPDLMQRLAPALPVRYELVREIGRGGMSRVFLARETQPRRDVAIKVLEPTVAAHVGSDRFLREVDIASKLAHPHIMPVYAAGDAAGLLYYVMPYLPGETLRDRLGGGPLDTAEAVAIAREIADALDYAHARQIVHRDIKPENVLFQGGHAIVADFGIARALAAGEASITGSGFVVGTPAYMSPEQASGIDAVDTRTDIYSLGCVLYEMLCGRPPHEGTSAEAVITQKLYAPAPSIHALRPDLPHALEGVVALALARGADDRYPDAATLRDALGRSLTPTSYPVTTPTVRTPARAPVVVGGPPPVFSPASTPVPSAVFEQRLWLTALLAVLMVVNWLETTFDNWLGDHSAAIAAARHQVAHAMQWIEAGLSFARHDATNAVAAYGYSAVYFLVFPALLLAGAVALARRPSVGAYRTLVFAVVADYLLSLPFFLFFPVPERWAFPEAGAVLLSDRWTSSLIEAARPISALDNCFPSFHVSLAAVFVLTCFVHRVRFRWTALVAATAVTLSTFVLGVHWMPDIVAGVAVACMSVAIARRMERQRLPALQRTGMFGRALPVLVLLALAAAPLRAQAPAFVAVDLEDTRSADEHLRRYLEAGAGLSFVAEQAFDQRTVIDRLTAAATRGPYLARVTPYALVAAELLGATPQVIGTYVSRATGSTTYASYLVVSRARFPEEPDLGRLLAGLRQAATPPVFAYHSQFSTSSYFLPAIFFRQNDVFDMASSSARATAIRVVRRPGSATDLVKAVATGEADLAAVWSGTRAAFGRGDSLAARYGSRVWFVRLPTVLPNDLLVASENMDSATVAAVRAAIRRMKPRAIADGDFDSWRELNDAGDAREALANLRWLARESPAPSTIDIRRAQGATAITDEQLAAARQAVRLAGLELQNFDPDFHAQQDYLWTLEPLHDGAIRLHSRIIGSEAPEQQFDISFRGNEELTARIGTILHTRLHRIRYVWPYRTDPPTILRDMDFAVDSGTQLEVRKIRWRDPHRHDYAQDAAFAAHVARADFFKFELAPAFIDPPDADGFVFNPMSNISYRVIITRAPHERPLFRVLTLALLLLVVGGGVAAALELRRGAA